MVAASASKCPCSLSFFLNKCQQILKRKMRLPDRWLDYSNLGEKIEGIPFICFKTPLSEGFSLEHSKVYGLRREEEFRPSQVCEQIKQKGLKLGLVIDLTNTSRYYNGAREFERNQGVYYKKLMFDGYNPSTYTNVFRRQNALIPVQRGYSLSFANTVNDFLSRNIPDTLIGVHCTHGVNRTGYLVCRYMIEELKYSPEDAIAKFNAARGHCIEKKCFLKDLPLRTRDSNSTQQLPSADSNSLQHDNTSEHFRPTPSHQWRNTRNNERHYGVRNADFNNGRITAHAEHYNQHSHREPRYHQSRRSSDFHAQQRPQSNEISYFQNYDNRQYNSWQNNRARSFDNRSYARPRDRRYRPIHDNTSFNDDWRR